MLPDPFHSPGWFRALTLGERIAALRAAGEGALQAIADPELAARRLQRWQSQPPFGDRSLFARRLAMDGVSEPDLSTVLGEPIEALRDRCATAPPWLSELASAFSRPGPGGEPLQPSGGEQASFLDVIRPLLDQAIARLRQHVAALAGSRAELPFDPATVVQICAAQLPESLMMLLSRTLVLELNVARLEGQLTGDSPQERFQSFARRLREADVARALLEEYPVLARQAVKGLERWLTVSGEWLHRLCDDWAAIRAALHPGGDPGPLVELHGAGDTHRGGRRVLIARFASGFRLVYKPKPLAADLHFQELLAWLDERGATPPFQTLRLLDRGEYGWVEHVAPRGCTSAAEIERFYERLGGYLALFYALEATDFHAENLLAAGEHPMPIDLEALFHPRLKGPAQPEAGDAASRALDHSVARVGLLPERIWATADSPGVDMSGMSNPEGQLTPFSVPRWKDPATDTMQLVRQRVPMLGTTNQPTLDGAPVNLLHHAEAIGTGFRRTYRLLLGHRDELLAEEGPLARFADDEVRVILRMTQTYHSLLRESFHPDVLRDALDRDRLLDRLWVQVQVAPHLETVIPAERADLLQGDLPMFVTRPQARDLWTSRNERIPDFFSESGLALARDKVRGLSEADLARQLWIIRASLATVATGVESVARRAGAAGDTPRAVDRERLLAGARAIGDRLETLAIRGERNATWLGLNLLDEQHWTVTPLGVDLYDGLPGVALFLAQLGAATGEERYAALARAALATLDTQVPQMKGHWSSIGAFSGWGGIVYALTHLAALWSEPARLDEAERLVELLPDLVARDDQLDVIGGSAGCIGALLGLYRARPASRTLAAAIACGDHLHGRAEAMPEGQGRAIPASGARGPLSGFSHGAAGMAWALLELAAVSGQERFRTTALEMIRYERTLFSREAQNWLDLREWAAREGGAAEPHRCATFWCHGAPGIGLGRLCSLQRVDDPATQEEIAAAVRTTSRSGFGHNHSLCHGDLGNLELLLHASRLPGGQRWRDDLERVTSRIVASIEADGWLCGNPLNVESPGLMTGLAGIGHGLLRLADPARVPSVLVLAPPLTEAASR
jgi:type 2 lantibiotic biosynthesis protein LanM